MHRACALDVAHGAVAHDEFSALDQHRRDSCGGRAPLKDYALHLHLLVVIAQDERCLDGAVVGAHPSPLTSRRRQTDHRALGSNDVDFAGQHRVVKTHRRR
eukprot:scaffold30559_cov69-Phaeocystis_antarctica.AAC.8